MRIATWDDLAKNYKIMQNYTIISICNYPWHSVLLSLEKNLPRAEWTAGYIPHHRRSICLVGMNRYSHDTTTEASKLEIGMRTHSSSIAALLNLGTVQREEIIRGGQMTLPALFIYVHAECIYTEYIYFKRDKVLFIKRTP